MTPMVRGRRPATTGMMGKVALLAWGLLGLAAGGAMLPTAVAHARETVLPVPRITIYPGNVITDEMLIDKSFRGQSTDTRGLATNRAALVGKVARGTLLPNVPVSSGAVREPFAVLQGQPAVVIFKSGALLISATAVPLQPGSSGDVISLRNTDSGTTIRGTVQPDGTVRVGMP